LPIRRCATPLFHSSPSTWCSWGCCRLRKSCRSPGKRIWVVFSREGPVILRWRRSAGRGAERSKPVQIEPAFVDHQRLQACAAVAAHRNDCKRPLVVGGALFAQNAFDALCAGLIDVEAVDAKIETHHARRAGRHVLLRESWGGARECALHRRWPNLLGLLARTSAANQGIDAAI